jgi:hypothetical protein
MLNWERPQRGIADVAGLNPIPPTMKSNYDGRGGSSSNTFSSSVRVRG